MADVQTTYTEARPIGLPGQLVDGEERNTITRTVETVAGIPWAAPAGRGTGDYQAIIGAGGYVFIGIAVRDASRPAKDLDLYARYANCRLMTRGKMWVTVGEAVLDGDTAYWNIATKKWTKTNTDLAVPGAKFDTTAAINGLAVLALNVR